MPDVINWGELIEVAESVVTNRDKTAEMARNPRGHNWMHRDGKIVHYNPRGRQNFAFSPADHTGGPYCARCAAVFCLDCENPYSTRCDALSTRTDNSRPKLHFTKPEPFGGGPEHIAYEEDE